MRKQWGQWPGIDADTFANLLTWADLDGFKLSWDVTSPLSRGEYPIWAWDRDGLVMQRAAFSLEELVSEFLLGGGLDRCAPPAAGGRWGLRESYVMRERRWFDAAHKPDETVSEWNARLALFDTPDARPPFQQMIVAALALGDTTRASARFDALNDSLNGYEASISLLEELLSPAADLIAPQTRVEWLETCRLLVNRFCPTYDFGPTDERLASLSTIAAG